MAKHLTSEDLAGFQRNLDRSGKAPAEIIKPAPKSELEKLNKLERAYFEWLKRGDFEWIGVQNVTLKIGNDCRYTCDFFTVKDGRFEARETKGKWFTDDSKVKLKVAARMFPWIRFILVRADGCGWFHQEIGQ